ncbi:MAG: T9SS type A sorting domain-containing protein [Cyclobacteriaceae bacterium]
MKRFLGLLFFLFSFHISLFGQVNVQDSLALVALYESTDGDNWTNNDNWLTGTVESWYGVTVVGGRVLRLVIHGNGLRGSLPSQIGDLTAIETLILNTNALSGSIPEAIGNLSNLEGLSLSLTLLTGRIPHSIGDLSKLKVLSLSNNNFLGGTIPDELYGLLNLEYLYLNNNNLIGEVSADLTNLNRAIEIHLNDNYLCEPSTIEFNNFTNGINYYGGVVKCDLLTVPPQDSIALVKLYMSTDGESWTNNTNWLTGDVDTWFGVTVENGRVTGIQLQDEVEEYTCCRGNNLIGVIPSAIGNLSELRFLRLAYNELSNPLPVELSMLAKLEELSLSDNQFEENIPSFFGTLENLQILHLSSNLFSGEIPKELGQLSSLKELHITDNLLTGELPIELGDLGNLEEFFVRGNLLSGELPKELGDMTSLQRLELNDNEFKGELPIELGNMSSLREMRLDENDFVGVIPLSLTNLNSLGLEQWGWALDYSSTLLCESDDPTWEQWKNGRTIVGTGSTCSVTDFFSYSILGFNELPFIDRNNHIIRLNLPDVDLNDLVAIFEVSSEVTVSVDGIAQSSGITANDFTNPVTYTISNEVGSETQEWQILITSESLVGGVVESEFNALTAFYNSTNGDNWDNNFNWLSNKPVEDWFGVNVENNRVVKIKLASNIEFNCCRGNNLTGTLPDEIGYLLGLKNLDLERNDITGDIPNTIGKLLSLQVLNMPQNQFSGSIPEEMTELVNLEFLQLMENELIGSIPAGLFKMPSLEYLNLGYNDLSGTVPSDIDFNPVLDGLAIQGNNITGIIPSTIGNLTNLSTLYLHDNQLSGTIPVELGNLTRISDLGLRNNQLSGSLPEELGNLTNIYEMFLDNNPLSGSIPLSFIQMRRLGGVDWATFNYSNTDICEPQDQAYQDWKEGRNIISSGLICEVEEYSLYTDSLALVALYESTDGDNWINNDNWLTGDVDTWFGVVVSNDRVIELDLDYNLLNGEIPEPLGQLSELQELSMSSNQLSGGLPESIGSLSKLKLLSLSRNSLSGFLLDTLGNLIRLESMYLNSNDFEGSIPSRFSMLQQLSSLNLTDNELSGYFPEALFELIGLEFLGIGTNDFIGDIPFSISKLINLKTLFLDNNGFDGVIPAYLGQLRNLERLDLGQNQFYGNVPDELGQLTNLKYLELDNNALFGPIPLSFVRLENLALNSTTNQFHYFNTNLCTPIDDAYAHWSDSRTIFGTDIFCEPNHNSYIDSIALVTLYEDMVGYGWNSDENWLVGSLDSWHGVTLRADGRVVGLELDNNNLSGRFPLEIGFLTAVEKISLKKNRIRGGLSESFKELINLIKLDLSENQLESEVPEIFNELSNLDFLDLESNRFEGAILNQMTELPELRHLNVGFNNLKEGVPEELSILTNLNFLGLNDNEFYGMLPESFIELLELDTLLIANNRALCEPATNGYFEWVDELTIYENNYTCALEQELESDSLALVYFYENTGGDNWKYNTNWLTGNIDTWYGVTLNGDWRVSELSLPDNELSGELPSEMPNLSELERLDLSANNLSGSIPSTIGQFEKLEVLVLANNYDLSGSVPLSLMTIENLGLSEVRGAFSFRNTNVCEPNNKLFENWVEDRNVYGSGLVCEINGNLTSDSLALVKFYFDNFGDDWLNNTGWLNAPVGQWYGIKILDNRVSELDLGNNGLKGDLSISLADLVALRKIDLSNNQLTGSIPSELDQLENVTYFNLSSNSIEAIPEKIDGMISLEFLWLSRNSIQVIPSSVGNLPYLRSFWITSNKLSTVPIELQKLRDNAQILLGYNLLNGLPTFDKNTKLNLNVENNYLTFEDLEPNLHLFSNQYSYWPQARFGEELYIDTIRLGQRITLDLGTIGGSANNYQWKKNGSLLEGANNPVLTIESFTIEDEAVYWLDVTSDLVPDATIQSEWITLLKKKSGENSVLEFELDGQLAPTTIYGEEREVLIKYGCSRSYDLIPTFVLSDGAKAFYNDARVYSEYTELDFSSPITIEVEAENGDRKEWLIMLDQPNFDLLELAIENNTSCDSEANGSVLITNFQEFAGFEFTWAKNRILVGNNESVEGLSSGTYSLHVLDPITGCDHYREFEIDIEEGELDVFSTIQHLSSCNTSSGSISLDSIRLDSDQIVLLPNNRFSLEWSTTGISRVLEVTSEGDYTVEVTDNETGCSYTRSFEVLTKDLEGALSLREKRDNTSCEVPNGYLNISANISSSQGIEYAWYKGSTASGTIIERTKSIDSLEAGSYTVRVTDTDTDCSTSLTATIAESQPTLDINLNSTANNSCTSPAGSVELAAIAVNGEELTSTLGYRIEWSQTEGFEEVLAQTREVNGLASGTYYARLIGVTTECISPVRSVTVVDDQSSVSFEVSTIPNSRCDELGNGSATLTALTTNHEIQWYQGEVLIQVQTSATISTLESGDYQVVVTDKTTGCEATKTFEIGSATPQITVEVATNKNTSCGDPDGSTEITEISVNGVSTSDMEAFSIEWWVADEEARLIQGKSAQLDKITGGDYFVQVTLDSIGCQSVPLRIIVEEDIQTFAVALLKSRPDLPGAQGTGLLKVGIEYTPNDVQITWYEGAAATGFIIGEDQTLENINAGDYTVKVTDSSTGCEVIATYDVGVDERSTQTINFDLPEIINIAELPLTLSATSDQGLPVSFTIVEGEGEIQQSTLTTTADGFIMIKAYNEGTTAIAYAESVRTIRLVSDFYLRGTVTGAADGSAVSGEVVVFTLDGEVFAQNSFIDGNYFIDGLTEGKYRLLLEVTGEHNAVAFDTYYNGQLLWNRATILTINDNTEVNVELIPKTTSTMTGQGSITGRIVRSDGGSRIAVGRTLDGTPLADVDIYLYAKSTNEVVAQAVTDEDGIFLFENVPSGEYYFRIDAVGFDIADLGADIGYDESQGILEVSAQVGSDGLTVEYAVVSGVEENLLQEISIYPNPAQNILHVEDAQNRIKTIQLMNLTGQLTRTFEADLSGQYDISKLSNGMYLIRIELEDQQFVHIKVVIRH